MKTLNPKWMLNVDCKKWTRNLRNPKPKLGYMIYASLHPFHPWVCWNVLLQNNDKVLLWQKANL
jgi:secreted Zn-dependent insulinase-like peptidase